MSIKDIINKSKESEENWISISDLMAGLMMVFLFIAIIFLRQEVSVPIIEDKIYEALYEEFEDDLEAWNAEIKREDLTIRFLSPDILFETGKAELKPRFKVILEDFIPRYITLLATNFSDEIYKIRIEGHTSSEWAGANTENEAFIRNMDLSQTRTRTVLEYSINLHRVQYLAPWMRSKVSAHGLSSAHLIYIDGVEDKRASKRVEFKVISNARQFLFESSSQINSN